MSVRIYKIVNDINEKIYVGKTCNSLEKRFAQHLSDAYKEQEEKRPLYQAIRKYGKEHFSIELIEECEDSLSSIREQYWIGYYEGYEKGYNATRGGDGRIRIDHDKVFQLIKQGKIAKEIADEVGCSVDWIYSLAKASKEKIVHEVAGSERAKRRVKQFDKEGNFIQSFESIADAARWLYEQGKVPTLNGGVRTHISKVCQHERKSAYKYLWEYD